VASLARHQSVDPFTAVLGTIALLLGVGVLAFAALPAPDMADRSG
jgi:hypothetical protein